MDTIPYFIRTILSGCFLLLNHWHGSQGIWQEQARYCLDCQSIKTIRIFRISPSTALKRFSSRGIAKRLQRMRSKKRCCNYSVNKIQRSLGDFLFQLCPILMVDFRFRPIECVGGHLDKLGISIFETKQTICGISYSTYY